MQILLIGNGFDLAHGLPTTYKEFLDFCEAVQRVGEAEKATFIKAEELAESFELNSNIKARLIKLLKEANRKKQMGYSSLANCEIETLPKVLNEFFSLIYRNHWLLFLKKQSEEMGDNWIDFEKEISRVVRDLESLKEKINNGNLSYGDRDIRNNIAVKFINYTQENLDEITSNEKLHKFIRILSNDLEKVIRALEIYIAEFVNSLDIKTQNDDIKCIHPDCVLSFNYSNTFERLYGHNSAIQYSYIHGKAERINSVGKCNLVLGIDEYLEGMRKDKDLEFIEFKKFYQRIYKATDNNYLEWADQIKDDFGEFERKQRDVFARIVDSIRDGSFDQNPYEIKECRELLSEKCPEHTLYIFGHSLDITDQDVLRIFICNDNVQTKVFYYRRTEDDKKELGRIIKNLIKVIGQDELIRRTGGLRKTIEFIPQSLQN